MNRTAWRSPSNIALVKYWGKFGRQLPQNPSLSFTLSQSHTNTGIQWTELEQRSETVQLTFKFEGQSKPDFQLRLEKFINSIVDELPFILDFKLDIASDNSFPHSSGIASSASAMSALALCLMEQEYKLKNKSNFDHEFYQRASHFARLGSGSACRSIYANAALWGSHHRTPHSSNDYAIPYTHLHDAFKNYCDSILIVDKGQKSVSSSMGHQLMNKHPFATQRFQRAQNNLTELLEALQAGDEQSFIDIVEEEALGLHGLMMSCRPSFTLLKPNTLAIIEKLRRYRKATGLPISFTLDAGPNVHLLYPQRIKDQVLSFIEGNLIGYCQDRYAIHDHMGQGPTQIHAETQS